MNNSPGEWELLAGVQTDFASSTMPTSIGWGHDIGFDSSFLHGKPVLEDGGHTPASRQFVNFLRYGVSRKFLSDEMLELLSTFNYKYVVLPEYLTENVRTFFLNQKGTKVVYNQSGSVILENKYHQNRVYSTANNVLVVGGTKSFFSTAKIADLDLNKNAFVFADQFENIDIVNDPLIRDSKAILLDDSNLLDLVMVSSEEIDVIDASHYAMSSRNFSAYWGKSNSWGDFGLQSFGGYTLSTCGNNKVTIPFEAQINGNYEILVRIGYNQYRSELMIHVDGAPIERIHPWADDWMGLKWVNLGTHYFEKGKHYLSLTNYGNGWNDVDAIAVVNSELLENQQNRMQKQIQSYQGRIIHRLTALHSFTESIPPEWQLVTAPYQGQVLESEFPETPISSNITILRESQYMFAVCLAQSPNTGNPQLKIDNTTVPLRHISSNNGSEMYEAGPVYLNTSTHDIEICGSGKIAFNQLICYSLNEDEKIVALTDFELHSTELGCNISPKGKVSSSSVGVWDPFVLGADYAVDGSNNTRWASEPYQSMPQWLQIDWDEPQNISGVRVLFEQA
ncbi:MAG: discoidin domain-containing protein, partial [Candidatus Bathyarchaeota archaeon]|nr:discoidin domain-containing protein [Candidatus Bathyarchaeota archaeon]